MTWVRTLLVGLPHAVVDDLEQRGMAVDRVGSVDEAAERLAGTGGPGPQCVVATVDDAADPVTELAASLDDSAVPVPLVLYGSQPLDAVADAVLEAGATAYVRADGADAPEDLGASIEDAAETYRRRLDRARIHPDGPDPGCILRDGDVAAASDAFGALFEEPAVVGDAIADLFADTDRDAVCDAIEDADSADGHGQLWVTPAADRRRTVELRMRRSPIDGAVVVRATDVSERARRRAALEEAASQLDSLLHSIPMSIYFKDEQGRHERVSDHITHTDPEDYIMNDEGKVHPHAEDVVGKTDFDLYAPSFAEETYADDMEVVEAEEPVVNRIESGTTSLGEPLYTSTTKVPRYEDGEVVGLVGVTMDVTERVTHREELERQNERLNEFAEVLTHDLRNPLNIVNGYLDVLETEYDQDAVDEIDDALDRMEALIEEIRSFVLEGRLVEDPEAVDLRSVAEEAWSTVDTGDATLLVEGDFRLKADRARLRRLLENLYRNALEHGRPGGGGEDLTVRVVGGDNEFAVEDDGDGIPPEKRTEVFERGFSTGPDGTGFGLAIVESIVEAHGWSVAVEESAEGGARFLFSDVVQAEPDFGRTIA